MICLYVLYLTFTFQFDPNARITSPKATIVFTSMNWSIGIMDPILFCYFTKKYSDEVRKLLGSIPYMGKYINQPKIKKGKGEDTTTKARTITSTMT